MNFRHSSTLVLTALACAVIGHAQTSTTTGAIKGAVMSKKGGPVAEATVILRSLDTGFTRNGTTNARGEYQFSLLPVGSFELTVTAKGLKTAKDASLRVGLGQTTTQNFSLDSAEAGAVIEVVADTAALDTAQINTQTSISQELMEKVPINGRNFTDLMLLTPGAAVGNTSYYTSVQGARGIQNNLQIDGASYNSKFNGEQRGGTRIPFTFGQDSIKELQVITNSFDAQYGDAVGAIINAVTKSGTNDPSGMAFMLYRPNSLVAKVKPVPYDPKGIQNDDSVRTRNFNSVQGGFNYGGPIIKDTLHYFVNVEWARVSEDSLLAASYNNTSGNAATDFNTFFSPTGMGSLLTAMPGRTLAQENHSPWSDQQTNLVVMARLDWTINSNHRATLRLNSQNYHGKNDIYAGVRHSDTAESGNSTMDFKSLSTVLELTSILSPSLLNEARLQLSNEKRPTTPNSTFSSPVRIANSGSGYYINAGQYYIDPRTTNETTTQFQDNVTYMTGDWVFKGGMDLQSINMKNRYLPSGNGNWSMSSYDAANQWFAGTLAGTGVSYTQGYSPIDGVSQIDETYSAGYLQAQYGGFLEKRLILSLGARFTSERWNGNPNPNPRLQGLDREPNDSSLDPRFGFSLDLFGNAKTVVRGGYGWFSVSNPGQTASGAIMNNGINLLSYYVSSATASYLSLFNGDGPLSAKSRWSGPTSAPGSMTVVPTSALSTLPLDSVTINLIDPNAKMAQARATSLGVEQDLGNGFTVAVRGTYKEFEHLQYGVNINLTQMVEGSTSVLSSTAYNDGYATTWNHFSNTTRPGRAIVRGRSLDLSGYGDVILSKYDGEGRYRSLVLEAARKSSEGWGFRGNLTFSKAQDNNSNEKATLTKTSGALTENPANPLSSYALSDNDHKFRAVLAWNAPPVYGVRISGITTFTTGRPFNAVYYSDQNGDGDYYNDTVAGRNTFRQPSEKTFDLQVARTFQVTKKLSLEGIVQVFNVFNWANQYTSQVNYANAAGSAPDSYTAAFGQIDRPDNHTREVQFTLKARF